MDGPYFVVASGTDLFKSAATQTSSGIVTVLTVIVIIAVGLWAFRFGMKKLRRTAK